MKIILSEKLGMTQVFDAAGNAVGATALKVLPSTVVRLRTKEKDGYEAMQVGAGTAKAKRVGKAVLGQTGGKAYRVLAEFPRPEAKDGETELKVGTVLGADQLHAGEQVHVTSVSKGKGFQGTVKRHNFSRGPKTHGSRNYRAPGSIGGTGATRVFAGQKMPGHMGAEQTTTRNLAVLSVDPEQEVVLVKGSVPGPRGCLVTVRGTGIETKIPVAHSLSGQETAEEAAKAEEQAKEAAQAEAAESAKAAAAEEEAEQHSDDDDSDGDKTDDKSKKGDAKPDDKDDKEEGKS